MKDGEMKMWRSRIASKVLSHEYDQTSLNTFNKEY